METQRILVTGGAGFIGSHLVEALLEQGASVVVLDDLSTGRRDNVPTDARLKFIQGDVVDEAAVREALSGCTSFVHLAAVASVERSVSDPLGTNRTNLQGTIQLLQQAANLGVARGLYASSAAVYGNATALPLDESAGAYPMSPYAADKLAGEHYLAHFHRSGRLNATAFRFFNVYGPRQDPRSPYSGAISIFLDRAVGGLPIRVFGDGHQTRDFIYVSDVVEALIAVLKLRTRPQEMPVYNVATGAATSLLDVLRSLANLPDVRLPLQVGHEPERAGDVRHSLGDNRKLIAASQWRPQVSLDEGLARLRAAL